MTSKDQTRAAMERMEAERTARRQALADLKCQRADEEKRIRDAGNHGDVDFVGLVQRAAVGAGAAGAAAGGGLGGGGGGLGRRRVAR